MCILTFITRYCERFPFILIGNRDEQLGRGTRHLRLDTQTGLLWALDELAGGSWMGIEPCSGRFTILTNCRRAPAAPLTCGAGHSSSHSRGSSEGASEAAADWRGAAPLSHIRRYTEVVPVRPELCSAEHPHAVSLRYTPPTSRGTIIKNYLISGELPQSTGISSSSSPAPPHSPLTDPFYAGYNLLSCDSLRSAVPLVCYTTNRYGAQRDSPVSAGEVHVLQNSFLDNTAGEVISARLRRLFESALHDVVAPLAANAGALTPSAVTDLATRLADACLCDRSDYDTAAMAAAEDNAALRATLHSTSPLLGFSEEELQRFFGDVDAPVAFSDGGAARVETYLQANILKKPVGGHGTRVQSMVLVERVPVQNEADGSTTSTSPPAFTEVLHFCQRDVSFEGPQQTCLGAPWIAFRIDADGTTTRAAG